MIPAERWRRDLTDSHFRRVAEYFFVAPQLQPEDVAAARAAGIRTVINNRPDGEAADQLSDVAARELASANGLPVRPGAAAPAGRRKLTASTSSLLPFFNGR